MGTPHAAHEAVTNTGGYGEPRLPLRFMWLEITGRCQLLCEHCYARSGPDGTHGTMTAADWERVIREAAQLGVRMVQFIGGEPTLHPDLDRLVRFALASGIEVEVFTNLVHVSPTLWVTFSTAGVRLATSWYSDEPGEHAAITGRPSHARTRAGIVEALRRSIPLRVGIIGVRPGQRTRQAESALAALGVTDIGYDDLRQVGRGIRDKSPSVEQLCGQCANGNLAVAPDGSVWPCVFARWLTVGNLREKPLREIVTSPAMASVSAQLRAVFDPVEAPCVPDMCNPQCGPSCSPACRPTGCAPSGCDPTNQCKPRYTCGPCAPDDRICNPDLGCKPNQCKPNR